MIKANNEGLLGAQEFAIRNREVEIAERENAGRFVAMLLPKEWMVPTYIHTLAEIAGIKRLHLNDALDSAIEAGLVETSLADGIRATDKFEVSDEQTEFIRQMIGVLRVRKETDEFIEYGLNEQLTKQSSAKAVS